MRSPVRTITVLSMDRECCWLPKGVDDEGNAVPTLILDARVFKDTPDGGHDGRSYFVQRKLVAKTELLREKLHRLKRFLSRQRSRPTVAVHVYCNRGKHRSVALAEQFFLLLWHVRERWAAFDEIKLKHRSFDYHGHLHRRCYWCRTGQGYSWGETKQALTEEFVLPLWEAIHIYE